MVRPVDDDVVMVVRSVLVPPQVIGARKRGAEDGKDPRHGRPGERAQFCVGDQSCVHH